MRITVLMLGLVLGAVMVTQAVVVTVLSTLLMDPLGSDAGAGELLMALLWLVGVAFVLRVPVVSILAFGAAATLGFTRDVVVREQFSETGLWSARSIVLAVFSLGGMGETLRADERDALKRAHIADIPESLER